MKIASTLLALAAFASLAQAADWPRWRGANFDDLSTETGLLKKWPSTGPKQAWMNQEVGRAYAGFSLVAGTLSTTGPRYVLA